jgi:hypothetical protein
MELTGLGARGGIEIELTRAGLGLGHDFWQGFLGSWVKKADIEGSRKRTQKNPWGCGVNKNRSYGAVGVETEPTSN